MVYYKTGLNEVDLMLLNCILLKVLNVTSHKEGPIFPVLCGDDVTSWLMKNEPLIQQNDATSTKQIVSKFSFSY